MTRRALSLFLSLTVALSAVSGTVTAGMGGAGDAEDRLSCLLLDDEDWGVSDTVDDSFYDEMAELYEQDSDNCFLEIQLTADSNIITVDGEERELSTAPQLQGEQFLLPAAELTETLGEGTIFEQLDMDSVDTVTLPPAAPESIEESDVKPPHCTAPAIDDEAVETADGSVEEAEDAEEAADSSANDAGEAGDTSDVTYAAIDDVAEALALEVSYSEDGTTATLTAPYQTSRIIVMTEHKLNTELLGAKYSAYDGTGMWLLQFETPAEAKAAVELLTAAGISAEPDDYCQPLDTSGPSKNWGVAGSSFPVFCQTYNSLLSGVTATIAVVDTGVRRDHEIFDRFTVLDGWNMVDSSSAGEDVRGHGTHVAGIIAGSLYSIADVATIRIMPIRISTSTSGGATSSALAAGLKKAADLGADVINLSYTTHSAARSAASYALDKGSLMVVAAGNDGAYLPDVATKTAVQCMTSNGTNDGRSSGKDGIVVVGAHNSSGNCAGFSNHGPTLDISAPGVSVVSSVPTSASSYGSKNGTSMAAPFAAAAALLIDMATGQSLSPADLEIALRTATTSNGTVRADDSFGYGKLAMQNAKIEKKTVTLNANGGSVYPESCPIVRDKTQGSLPVPTREGYAFAGWYSALTNGTRITADTIFSKSTTIYARWFAFSDVTVNGGAGSGSYHETQAVTITAAAPAEGKRFDRWIGTDGLVFTDGGATSETATFKMPDGAVTLTAVYEDIPYALIVNGSAGSGIYICESPVILTAESSPGKEFVEWSGTDGLTLINGSANSPTVAFIMPAKDVTLTAVYESLPFTLSVDNGTGGNDCAIYRTDSPVTVTAAAPPDGKRFDRWVGADGLVFTDGGATSAKATFLMPGRDASLVATYTDLNGAWSILPADDLAGALENKEIAVLKTPDAFGYKLGNVSMYRYNGASKVFGTGEDGGYIAIVNKGTSKASLTYDLAAGTAEIPVLANSDSGVVKGDMNGNEAVTAADSGIINAIVHGSGVDFEITDWMLLSADMNHDGKVSASDIVWILEEAVGKPHR